MRLISFTDFGLHARMRMAAGPDRGFSTDGIARGFAISRHHLTRVVRDLARAGFVNTQRGGGGGLRLARPPAVIRFGAVVRALESRKALVACCRTDAGNCRMTAGCVLAGRLAGAREAFLNHFGATTLAKCAWAPAEV